MTGFTIAQLERFRPDATGTTVVDIETRLDGLFAVYYTEERVMIQFSDDQALGADQRKALAPVSAKRAEISALLSELRNSGKPARVAAERSLRRDLGASLAQCLRGELAEGEASLDKLLKKLTDHRNSRGRLRFVLTAFVAGLAMMIFAAIFTSGMINYQPDDAARTLWYAGCVGIVGAFFSVAIAVRDRSLEADRVTLDTTLDAALRMFVGALGGALLLALIQSGAVGLIIGGARIVGGTEKNALQSLSTGWLLILLVAFVGGFFERMVPDLLNKATTADGPGVQPASSRRTAATEEANERNPLGRSSSSTGAAIPASSTTVTADTSAEDLVDEDADDCCDHDGYQYFDTEDVELPEAIGGVEVNLADSSKVEDGQ